jgi:peptidoglycan/LPS O-acetylase OafA/YrhL
VVQTCKRERVVAHGAGVTPGLPRTPTLDAGRALDRRVKPDGLPPAAMSPAGKVPLPMALYERLSAGDSTAPDPRSAQLDALRALAVLMVLTGHAYLLGGVAPEQTSRAPADMLINAGGAGIWIFFSLSGYLIAAPFLRALADGRPLPSLRRYAVRRAGRILPAYWLAFAALLVLVPPATSAWWQLPLHLGLLHNLAAGEGQALFFVAWTLGIEALFYVFVGVAAWVVRRLRGPAPIPSRTLLLGIAALWALSLLWTVVTAVAFPGEGLEAVKWADVFRLSLPGLLSVFCPGLLIAVALHARERGLERLMARPLALTAAAVVIAAVGALMFAAQSSVVFDLSRDVWAIAAGLLLIAALGAGSHRLLRLVAPIGLISYGLYLWHWVVVKVLLDTGVDVQAGPLSWPLRTVLVLALSVPLAVASWLLVERPILRRTSRWRRSSTPAAAKFATAEA